MDGAALVIDVIVKLIVQRAQFSVDVIETSGQAHGEKYQFEGHGVEYHPGYGEKHDRPGLPETFQLIQGGAHRNNS